MESGATVFQNLPHPGGLPEATASFHADCLTSVLELLGVLREEAQILKRFAGAELLALVPKKEYLVTELEWKLKSAREAGEDSFMGSDYFSGLLNEMIQLNASNGVFIKKSLSYWRDLLSILLPPSYGLSGKTAAVRRHSLPKGRAFRRKA